MHFFPLSPLREGKENNKEKICKNKFNPVTSRRFSKFFGQQSMINGGHIDLNFIVSGTLV